MIIIGDHLLITCQLKINQCTIDYSISQDSDQQLGISLNVTNWDRRDHGNLEFWLPMRTQLEQSLEQWEFGLLNHSNASIDSIIEEFNSSVNIALLNSLKIRKNCLTSQKKLIHWNSNLYKLSYEERKAFLRWKEARNRNLLVIVIFGSYRKED